KDTPKTETAEKINFFNIIENSFKFIEWKNHFMQCNKTMQVFRQPKRNISSIRTFYATHSIILTA
ncbi:MAG: hypothetical protein IKX14_00870, partial [Neisseriaceae bacterium]|nr:hypothetical protein [Neisseriaceae bacterium]